MSTTQTGNPGPFRMADEIEWDERNGTTTTMVFRGAKREIDGLVPTYQVPGYRVTRRQEAGDIWRAEVRASLALDGSDPAGEAAVQIQWDLDGNDYSISIYKAMVLRAVPQNLVSCIEASVNQLRAGTFTREVLINATGVGIIDTATAEGYDTADAVAWFDIILGGVETHDVSNFLLRKVTTAPNAWVSTASPNVGKLYTTAQLLAEEPDIPSGITAEFPSDGYWKKNTPRRSTTGIGKIQIQQDWQHATTFSALQYDLVT